MTAKPYKFRSVKIVNRDDQLRPNEGIPGFGKGLKEPAQFFHHGFAQALAPDGLDGEAANGLGAHKLVDGFVVNEFEVSSSVACVASRSWVRMYSNSVSVAKEP